MGDNRIEIAVRSANGQYEGLAESFLVFVPKKVKTAQGEKKASIPCPVRRIYVTCLATSETFKFPYTVRGGVGTFGDSRDSAKVDKRWSQATMRAELARMMGPEAASVLLSVMAA
jgi:hypothetical protein